MQSLQGDRFWMKTLKSSVFLLPKLSNLFFFTLTSAYPCNSHSPEGLYTSTNAAKSLSEAVSYEVKLAVPHLIIAKM